MVDEGGEEGGEWVGKEERDLVKELGAREEIDGGGGGRAKGRVEGREGMMW